MSSADFSQLVLQLAAMLACAVLSGSLFRRLGQPPVLGEMIGGIVLGPTVFGAISPGAHAWLFHGPATVTSVRDASVKLGMLFFMFQAGMQVSVGKVRRLGPQAAAIGLGGTLLPMATGIALVQLLPASFWGRGAEVPLAPFALFIGMNLANSANSVIARILMDLNLLRADVGALIMTATVMDDFVNWTVFAIVLNQIGAAREGSAVASLSGNIATVVVFFVAVLAAGRWLARRGGPWIEKRLAGPAAVGAVATLAMLLAGGLAEWVGAHAFLGAFLMGAAFGNGGNEVNRGQETMLQSVASFFAPLYFVSMGLNADFIRDFQPSLAGTLLVAACGSKFVGVLAGAWVSGLGLGRRSVAIGFGLNARGATGLVLAGVGLEYGLVGRPLFVALVLVSVITSVIAVPALQRLAVPHPAPASPARDGSSEPFHPARAIDR